MANLTVIAANARITEHFVYHEFRCRDGTDYPPVWLRSRLTPLCLQLEIIRTAFDGMKVTILSGYRTPEYNRKIGGAERSQHCEGRAADIDVYGIAPSVVHAKCLELYREGKLLIGGLGDYPTFTHLDVRPGSRLARWSGGRRTS